MPSGRARQEDLSYLKDLVSISGQNGEGVLYKKMVEHLVGVER